MSKNHVKLSELAKKVREDDFEECLNCPKVVEIEGFKHCPDGKCSANKKRLFTRMKKIRERAEWRELEHRLTQSGNKLLDNPAFPYILLESAILSSYDEELKSFIASKLEIKPSELKKKGVNEIYKLDPISARLLSEIVVLKTVGLKRAKDIVDTKIDK